MKEEPLIGREIDGIRRTEDGFVKASWWFFQKEFEDKKNPYWYAKKRSSPDKNQQHGRIKEKYIGKELPFDLPKKLMTKSEWRRYVRGELVIIDEPIELDDREKMLRLKRASKLK